MDPFILFHSWKITHDYSLFNSNETVINEGLAFPCEKPTKQRMEIAVIINFHYRRPRREIELGTFQYKDQYPYRSATDSFQMFVRGFFTIFKKSAWNLVYPADFWDTRESREI